MSAIDWVLSVAVAVLAFWCVLLTLAANARFWGDEVLVEAMYPLLVKHHAEEAARDAERPLPPKVTVVQYADDEQVRKIVAKILARDAELLRRWAR